MKEIHHYDKKDFQFSLYKFSAKNKNTGFLPLHIHEDIEIIYFTEGNAIYEINFKEYLVDSESIIIINKNLVHGAKSVNSESPQGIAYVFDSTILEGSFNDFASSKYISPLIGGQIELPVVIKRDENEEFFDYLKNILSNIQKIFEVKKYAYELKIKSDILNFFAHLFENSYTKSKIYSEKDILKRKKIEAVFYYIHKNYKKNIGLKELASFLSLSETYFSKFFREYTGYKFIDYLNYYRLTQSSQLLINSSMPITDICYEVGFQNLSYYIKTFKKEFRHTPSDYRKINSTIQENIKI